MMTLDIYGATRFVAKKRTKSDAKYVTFNNDNYAISLVPEKYVFNGRLYVIHRNVVHPTSMQKNKINI